MKKNRRYLNSAFALVLSGFALVSCNDNDPDYVFNEKPAVSTNVTNYTVNEGEEASIVLTTSKMISSGMEFKLEVLGNSTATIDEDFTLPGRALDMSDGLGVDGSLVTFPGNTNTFTVKIPTILDDEFEQDEVISLRIRGAHNMLGTMDQVINITIKNAVKDELDLTLAWDKTFEAGGQAYSLCDLEYDVDILVFDSGFNPIGDGAQTGDCPEHLVMPMADYPDGTYLIVGYLYGDAGVPAAGLPEFSIPITVDYFRGGSATLQPGSYTQASGFLTSNSQGENSAGAGNGDITIIAGVKIENGVFTILNPNDNSVIAQGRSASTVNKMAAAFKAKAGLKKHKK